MQAVRPLQIRQEKLGPDKAHLLTMSKTSSAANEPDDASLIEAGQSSSTFMRADSPPTGEHYLENGLVRTRTSRPRRRMALGFLLVCGAVAGAVVATVRSSSSPSNSSTASHQQDSDRSSVSTLRSAQHDGSRSRNQNRTVVYLGNGCFWERQFAYVQVEGEAPFGRTAASAPTAVVGYAGGTGGTGGAGPGGLVCYHHSGSQANVYSHLGHAEVVAVELDAGAGAETEKAQFRALAKDYFSSFHRLASGKMQRPDPGDRGSEYRNLVGIPSGTGGPLYPILAQENVHGMALKAGAGSEQDVLNTVWVLDSDQFPFFRGEQYHQYHSNFFGASYGSVYLNKARKAQIDAGHIEPTGCPEGGHW